MTSRTGPIALSESVRHAYEAAELMDLVRSYVTPDRGYLKLCGSWLRLEVRPTGTKGR